MSAEASSHGFLYIPRAALVASIILHLMVPFSWLTIRGLEALGIKIFPQTHIKDVYQTNNSVLDAIPDETARLDKLCELNVAQQVANVCHTTIVQNAWHRGQFLNVHGWIYKLTDGLLQDLNVCATAPGQIPLIYRVDR